MHPHGTGAKPWIGLTSPRAPTRTNLSKCTKPSKTRSYANLTILHLKIWCGVLRVAQQDTSYHTSQQRWSQRDVTKHQSFLVTFCRHPCILRVVHFNPSHIAQQKEPQLRDFKMRSRRHFVGNNPILRVDAIKFHKVDNGCPHFYKCKVGIAQLFLSCCGVCVVVAPYPPKPRFFTSCFVPPYLMIRILHKH